MPLNNPQTGGDAGQIKMPSIGAGMNKRGPGELGKGRPEDDAKTRPLGQEKDEEKDDEVLERARKRFDWCVSYDGENRKAMLQDIKFVKGDQWPADIAAQRNFENRPCLTINKLPTFIHQITNAQRENRPAILVRPIGDRGDPDAAKVYRGMIASIWTDSHADIAVDTAFEASVRQGRGFYRLRTDWESEDSFEQIAKIERIRNAFTVYLDPAHQEPDGSDANFGFVTEVIPTDEFKALYPDADISAFDKTAIGDKYREWSKSEGIRIAEYYEVRRKKAVLVKLSNGHVGFEDDLSPAARADIAAGKIEIVDERDSYRRTVQWYKITGVEILEQSRWLGQWIPIFPVIGDEIDIEGKVYYSGVVRNALDSQRMYNYWRTKETEAIALAPMAPWIAEEGQIEGYEEQWKNANTKPYSVLPYRGVSIGNSPAPPPQRQNFAQVPAGIVNAAEGAARDMMATTGIRFDSTPQERMMDESGKALRELRRTSDIGNMHYDDNLCRSLIHLGRQLVDLIPKLYDSERQATILREDGKEERIVIDPHANKAYEERKDPKTGKTTKIFNPSVGKYGIKIDTGPNYTTRRQEAADQLLDFARALPNSAALIMDLIAKYQDWPGSEEIANRLAKAIPPQYLAADQKDMTPQVAAVIQNLEAQVKGLHTELQRANFALTDKEKDRGIAMAKINADFEAKLLAIVQKAEDSMNKNVGSKVEAMAADVQQLMAALTTPPAASAGQPQETSTDA